MIVLFEIMNSKKAKQKDFSKFLTTDELGTSELKYQAAGLNLLK